MSNQKWPQRRNGRAILAAVAGVTLSLFLVSACGGGDGDSPALSGGEVSAAGVTLTLPEGWAFLDNGERGLVLAELEADLTVVVPQGPRLTVEPGSTDPPDPEALAGAIAGAGAARVEVVEEPETVSVGVEEGVSIGLREGEGGSAVIRRYVIVSADGISVYQFVLEAPEGGWNDSVDTLESVLASAEFGVPARASTLEDYFQRLEQLNDEFGQRSDDLETQLDQDIAAITTEGEAIDLVGRSLSDAADVLEDFLDGLDQLNPPSEAEQTHAAVVTAGRRTVDAFRGLLSGLADAGSAASLETMLSDPTLQDAIAAFNQTCSEMQAVAEGSGIDVILNCGQE